MWRKVPNWEEYEVDEIGRVRNALTKKIIGSAKLFTG